MPYFKNFQAGQLATITGTPRAKARIAPQQAEKAPFFIAHDTPTKGPTAQSSKFVFKELVFECKVVLDALTPSAFRFR